MMNKTILPNFIDLIVSIDHDKKIGLIQMNRPKRKNALSNSTYTEISNALKILDNDNNIHIVVITGIGDWYSSGNDLANFQEMALKASEQGKSIQQVCNEACIVLEDYINTWIDFSKPLIAAVNGPAMGVAVTTLALCDVIFCTEHTFFQTPFSRLGQSPEGLSSYLFPKILGHSKANEMLLFGQKLTAQQALDYHFVSKIYKIANDNHNLFLDQILKQAIEYAKLPNNGLKSVKKLIKSYEIKELKHVNHQECLLLAKRFASEECAAAVMKFMMNQKKKKKKKK